MILVNFKIIHIIFSVILFLLFLLSTSQRAFSETYISQNLSMGCKFVFSNYFKNIIKIKNNNAIFSINQKDPSVLFSKTDELDVSIQITVKKINNPKSPTITLFMALEKDKSEGNFIIPNLRQNLCNGKFRTYNLTQNNLKTKKTYSTKLDENIKKNQILNIPPLKAKTFFMGKFDFNSLETIKISSQFPKYRLIGEERCKSNKRTNNVWKNNIIFYADENLFWAVKDYTTNWRPENGLRIYFGTRKKDKIVFKIIEAHDKWNNMMNWIDGYSLDLKNKNLEYLLNKTLTGKYASSGSYRRSCELKFLKIIKTKSTSDHLNNISVIEKKQRKALEIMNQLGIRFKQKYGFEEIKYLVEKQFQIEKIENKKLAEQKAKLKAQKLAEQKAKLKAQKLAEQKAKLKAQKLAEQKAIRDDEVKKQENNKKISEISEKYFETFIKMKNIFEVGESYIQDHPEIQEVNNKKVELNNCILKSFDQLSIAEKKECAKSYVEYTSWLFKLYNQNLKSGNIQKKNDFQELLNKYIPDQINNIEKFDTVFEAKKIFIDFKKKFDKSDWPTDINGKILESDMYYTQRALIKFNSKSNDIWNKFIYPSNIYIKRISKFDKNIKVLVESSSEKFRTFYNQQKYKLNIRKKLEAIKNKQENLSVFDKLGN